jgi:hypothetical protein
MTQPFLNPDLIFLYSPHHLVVSIDSITSFILLAAQPLLFFAAISQHPADWLANSECSINIFNWIKFFLIVICLIYYILSLTSMQNFNPHPDLQNQNPHLTWFPSVSTHLYCYNKNTKQLFLTILEVGKSEIKVTVGLVSVKCFCPGS